MKIKPLIKTHWVASQNPLTVSLAGLRRVVFTPPGDLFSLQFTAESGTSIPLPPAHEIRYLTPEEGEIREIRGRTFISSQDLFWNAFSGHDMAAQNPTSVVQRLARSLEFHFENGTVLGLPGVFHWSGFPLFLSPKYYLQDSSCNWERGLSRADEIMKPLKVAPHLKKNENVQRTWILILETLAWALQRQRQTGDLEVLWCGNSSRQASLVQDIEFHKELQLAATVLSEPETQGVARVRIWQSVETPVHPGVLQMHSAEALAELENYFLGPQGKTDNSSPSVLPIELETMGPSWNSQFVFAEGNTQDLLKSLDKIEQSLGGHHLHLIHHTLVTGSDFKPIVKVRESEGSLQMSVSYSIDALKLQHLNFPSSMASVMTPFLGGLETILKLDRKETASRNNQYRANDLLFLRHQGLVIFCLFELINWVLKRPLSSGEVIPFVDDLESVEADHQFEKVIRYLQASLPALLGQTSVPFKELVSPKVQELFLDFVEKLFRTLIQDRSLFFWKNQLVEMKGLQNQTLPLIRFLILHFIESTQGKFLLKIQAPLGERFPQSLPQWTSPQILPQMPVNPYWVDVGLFDKYSVSLLFELCDEGFDVELNGKSLLQHENPFEFVFSVKDAALEEDWNWFDLHPEIFFNGTKVATEEVKINFGQGQVGFIEYQGQIYRIDKKQLPSLKSLHRFWERIKGLRQSTSRESFGDKVYRLEKSQALELLMLKSQGFQVNVEGEWKRIFDYFENGLGVEKIELPEAMLQSLLPHQKAGAQWLHDLYELKLGAILADEMGLGKTFQVLSFLVSLQQRNKLKKCLIIVPTSLVYNWVEEKKKFAPSLPMRVFHSSEQEELKIALAQEESMVLVATYGLLIENTEFFQSQDWNILAFDEAQNLKNITSVRSVSARKLKAQFKVCVTGTPMENNYLEFFSLCDLVVPGCLGNIDAFRRQYYNRDVRSESLRELRLVSKPLVLRRTKQDVKLSLPTKTIHKISLPFTPKQKEIYKKMAMTFSRQVDELIQDQGERKAQIAMFSALMRLRQICSDPAAVPGVSFNEQPAKVEHFLNSLQEHLENGESVVVFTQFLSTLKRLEKALETLKVPAYTLQGSVSAKERIRLISEFQNNKEPAVMLMTLKTGGVGLNLTKASVVYHLEPWWNPAVENQATDRAHRMGQTKDVTVYNLLIEGSLEERIADLKLKKQDSFDRLFGVDEDIDDSGFEGNQSLTREDFIYLLK